MKRLLVSLVAVLALAVGAAVAPARGGHDRGDGNGAKERVFTLQPHPGGNPEGIAFDKKSRSFFVGIVSTGAIYRGTLKSDIVEPFIAGATTGKSAVGMKVKRGLLYVAGGMTGTITVYDIDTKEAVATFETGAGGFLNDLVVTKRGDVYVTDSFRPTLWHVTAEQVEAGSGTPQALPVGDDIDFEAGEFNLNGIVAKSPRKLIVVDSNSGELFRIKLNADGDAIDEIDQIEGATVQGDGMLLDRGKLVVVQGNPAQLVFLKLRRDAREARIVRTQTSDKLHGPSTVDRAKKLYLVVNADFANTQPTRTVAGLPRKAKHARGNGHGDDKRGRGHGGHDGHDG